MMRISTWLLGVMLLAMGGCTTMSVEECKVARWGEVGLRDGLAGQPLSKLDDLSKDCAEAKVTVDTNAYLQGRDQGLITYCRPSNAVKLGLEGKYYQGACPASIDADFRRRYGVGREVYDSREQVRNLDSRRMGLERQLRDAQKDDDRRKYRNELSDLDYSLRRARDRVRDAEWALDRMR
ncbi:MAG: DUF2799 domain-containing protein [Betaproteobacteria bacterium]|nr:DUF2799 domain-containing protein [Betaproteobacteria bacterium]